MVCRQTAVVQRASWGPARYMAAYLAGAGPQGAFALAENTRQFFGRSAAVAAADLAFPGV